MEAVMARAAGSCGKKYMASVVLSLIERRGT